MRERDVELIRNGSTSGPLLIFHYYSWPMKKHHSLGGLHLMGHHMISDIWMGVLQHDFTLDKQGPPWLLRMWWPTKVSSLE